VSPTEMTNRMDLLPRMMDVGIAELGCRKREMLPGSGVLLFNASESVTHSVCEVGVWSVIM
jgi:hypothetical protein